VTGPVLALTLFGVLAGLVALVFWPGRGIAARLARVARTSERVRMEDALKHVYTCESVGRACSLESVAGQLGVSTGKAAALLERLSELELVRSGPDGPALTDEGRSSALQLVRTHRLWERYLADRTSVPPSEWHAEAEHVEHELSPEETDRLAARLGHPRWDPHGDPIPTASGDLPVMDDATLASVEPGTAVEVVHLEDEPRELYEALLEEGLALGTRLEVIERTPNTVRIRAGGRSWSLPALTARNVTVRPLADGDDVDRPVHTLRDLSPGMSGVVQELSPACRGAQRRRLLDLGIVRGARVTAELASAFGDPVAYRIRGALIALRGEQAEWIRIAPPDEAAEEGAA
jgi:DtxR family transcriptional regulator, Mn-dependent transcriptional regulator